MFFRNRRRITVYRGFESVERLQYTRIAGPVDIARGLFRTVDGAAREYVQQAGGGANAAIVVMDEVDGNALDKWAASAEFTVYAINVTGFKR